MLTKTEAMELVSKKLLLDGHPDDQLVIVEQYTIEKPFGWVFFFNSKKFLDTGIFRYRLLGNGPVIVNKVSGAVEFHGSNKPPEDIIKDYERKLAEDS